MGNQRIADGACGCDSDDRRCIWAHLEMTDTSGN
jgi:hypothetical protein